MAHNITIATGGLATIPAGATTFSDTGDYTVAPSALNAVPSGTISLRANNDITFNNSVHLIDGVGLFAFAGRNFVQNNSEINVFLANVQLIANANVAAHGVNAQNRDTGEAVLQLNSAIINLSSSGTLQLIGDTGNATQPAASVGVSNSQVLNATMTISGRGTSARRNGVSIDSNSTVASQSTNTISISGVGFAGTNLNRGVTIAGVVSTVNGSITIDGTGAGSATANYGVEIAGSVAAVRSTGTGPITINGTGGNGTTGNFGVEIDGVNANGARVQTKDGLLTISGTGGGGVPNFGVSIEHQALVGATGTGSVVIDGKANGISFNPFNAGGGALGVVSGNVTLTGDTINLDATGSIASTSGGTSQLLFQPSTPSRPIRLGGGAGGSELLFNDTSRAAITGFGQITIGRNNGSGNVIMTSVIATIAADVVVQTPQNSTGGIAVSRTLDVGNRTLTLISGRAITQATGGLLKAARLGLQAATGVGSAASPLQTQASFLEAVTNTGGVFVNNSTSALAIGGASGTIAGVQASTSGNIAIANTGSLLLEQTNSQVTGAGNITLQAGAQLVVAQNLTITGTNRTLTLTGEPITVGFSTLNAGSGGQIVLNGETALSPSTGIFVTLGPARAGGLPFVQVHGTIRLNAAALTGSVATGQPPGTTFTIISNDQSDAVTGTLSHGAVFRVGDDSYLTRYAGGDGNDVVLARPSPPGGNDFSGDGKSDYAVYRLVDNDYDPKGTAKWFTIQNNGASGALVYDWARQWGISSDTPVPGDYDGDGKADYTVFRTDDPFVPAQGQTNWYIALNQGNGVNVKPMRNLAQENAWPFTFGEKGDIPVPGDYNGDGKSDLAVYRPSEGKFYVKSLTFTLQGGEYYANLTDLEVGLPIWNPNGTAATGGEPVAGDFNGDGRTDFAVYQTSGNQGVYRIRLNLPNGTRPYTYAAIGQPGDKAVAGDFDADGRTDLVLYRPVDQTPEGFAVSGWYVWSNLALGTSASVPGTPPAGNNLVQVDYRPNTPGTQPFYHGLQADTPIAADVNGDLRSDFMVFRPDERTVNVPGIGNVTVAAWYTLTNLPGNTPGQWDWGRLHGVRTDNAIGRYPLVNSSISILGVPAVNLAGVRDTGGSIDLAGASRAASSPPIQAASVPVALATADLLRRRPIRRPGLLRVR